MVGCTRASAPNAGTTPGHGHDEPALAGDHDAPVPDGRDKAVVADAGAGDRPTAAEAFRCDVYDAKNPACRGVCPGPDAVDDACQHCPSPPDPDLVACQRIMPCPNPPDRRFRACLPPRRANDGSVVGRVLKVEATKDGLVIVIGVGRRMGIDVRWRGAVLIGGTESLLENGDVVLVRVDKVASVGKLHLTIDQLGENHRVRLVPP